MLNMNQKLIKRQQEGKIIKTGIVGAGQMGRGMVTQMVLMNGIMPAIVSDIKVENAVNAFKYAGVTDEDIVIAKTIAEANAAIEKGKYVATESADFVSKADLVNCVIDATGVPDVGARVSTDAIANKKHVVMLNVETDIVIGPYLKKLAEKELKRQLQKLDPLANILNVRTSQTQTVLKEPGMTAISKATEEE